MMEVLYQRKSCPCDTDGPIMKDPAGVPVTKPALDELLRPTRTLHRVFVFLITRRCRNERRLSRTGARKMPNLMFAPCKGAGKSCKDKRDPDQDEYGCERHDDLLLPMSEALAA